MKAKKKNLTAWTCRLAVVVGAAALVLSVSGIAFAAVTPPDTTVCDGVDACSAPRDFCDAEGFRVTLKSFTPAATSTSGKATYVYEICEPAAGICSVSGASCLDNSGCGTEGGICRRACAVNKFHGLSHFDVGFPLLAETSCLGGNNEVTGSCQCKTGSSSTCTSSPPNFTIGDGSCFGNDCLGANTGQCQNSGGSKTCSNTGVPCNNDGQCTVANSGTCQLTGEQCTTNQNCPQVDPENTVAKCDNTNLSAGDCIVMTLEIAGETSDLGVGPIVLVTKDATTCQATCGAGPSCNVCNENQEGEQCLTRTIGFWGTHPWITNNYVPVTVCDASLTCNGAPDGKSAPSCEYGHCDDVMEGLGSIPSELNNNQPYVAMVKQLTAAKLNLSATSALTGGAGECSTFTYPTKSGVDQTIQQWITYCESLCGANKTTITNSGCIEALDAFNNSGDTGFAQTPPPFDRPSVDDSGDVSGADPSAFTAAQKSKVVIGKNIGGGGQCQQ